MSSEVLDVIVVGAADGTAEGRERLAAALAAGRGSPEAVARAIAQGALRVGQALTRSQAETLAARLQAVGALVQIRAAAGAPAARPPGPATTAAPGAPTLAPLTSTGLHPAAAGRGPLTSTGAPAGAPTLAPLTSTGLHAAMPTAVSATGSFPVSLTPTPAPVAFPGLPTSPVLVSLAGTSPQPAFTGPRPISGAYPAVGAAGAPPGAAAPAGAGAAPAGAAAGAAPSQDLFAPPSGPAASAIELDFGDRAPATPPRPSATYDGAAAPGLARTTSAAADVALDRDDTGNPNLVRCLRHGLRYDKSKSSGCLKCLSGARRMAAQIEDHSGISQARAAPSFLRASPARRATLGLGFALVLGLLPAVFHAFRLGPAEAKRLRIEQEELSRRAGTDEVYRRFDELEDAVAESRRRAMRNTGLVWLVVSAGALAGWYRLT